MEEEIIYFVLPDRFANGDPSNDRGGLDGGRLDHGYDPTNHGFYHGGDLKGLTERLDYVQGLGATAVWFAPVFKNKPVQGAPDVASAGYHGYWITDFLDVDPHFGRREEFKAFVEAAHARGMKVYMDIITNHTADVIYYRECHDPSYAGYIAPDGSCPYRSRADYPWTTRGGPDGEAINPGFLGDEPVHQTSDNFARLTDPTYAYTPVTPPEEANIKNPAWLNDMALYHHRGDSFWEGESAIYGDFSGLDDLMTQHPKVLDGMIEIYKSWITDYRVDGFRIDTAKHVRPEFWTAFTPAILEHAHSQGIEHFHIFGEVYNFDPAGLARFTTEAGLPTVLDFGFQGVVRDVLVNGASARRFEAFFEADWSYANGPVTANQSPTFLGNHDMGRFAGFLREAHPEMSDAEQLARVKLGHALMMFTRGVPTIYYGDEQGFVSDGGDRDARESLFPAEVASYNDNVLIGTDATTAQDNYDTSHPLYVAISQMAALRAEHDALRGGQMTLRHTDYEGGVMAVSKQARTGDASPHMLNDAPEYMVVFNTGESDETRNVATDGRIRAWTSVRGACPGLVEARGAAAFSVPALDYVICQAVYDEAR